MGKSSKRRWRQGDCRVRTPKKPLQGHGRVNPKKARNLAKKKATAEEHRRKKAIARSRKAPTKVDKVHDRIITWHAIGKWINKFMTTNNVNSE